MRVAPALVLAGLLLLGGAQAAARPAAGSAHPRIWLDAATLKTLRARVAAKATEWKALRAACDTYAKDSVQWPDGNDYADGSIAEGYQGDGYVPAVASLGLCWQLTRKAAYAAKGAEVLTKMSASSGPHVQDPLRDDGYGVRNYPLAMALGYDWLYPALSAGLRAQLAGAMERWLGAYERDGFEHAFPQGNYFAGYFAADALAALATDGDTAEGSARWQDWLTRVWGELVKPYYAANLSGGGWSEGWNYGPLATLNMAWTLDAVRTAKRTDLAAGFPWLANSARFLVHFTWPDLRSLEDSGIVYGGPNPSATSPLLVTGLAGVLERRHDRYAPVFHSYAAAVRRSKGVGEQPASWLNFLFWNPKARSTSFRSQPLSYFAPGLDLAAMRSSWQPDAVWADFRGGPYVDYPDAAEESFDSGALTIQDGSKQFLVNGLGALVRNSPGTEDGDGFYNPAFDDIFGDTGTRGLYNVFYVSEPKPTGQEGRLRSDGARASLASFTDGGGRVVLRATHLEDMYPRNGADPTISSWTRDVVYVRPDVFVVHDRTSVTDGGLDEWLAWHFRAKPAAAGSGRWSVGGGSVQVLGPSGASGRIVDVLDSHKVYRLEVHGPDGKANLDWVTVLQPRGGPVATLDGDTVHVGAVTVKLP